MHTIYKEKLISKFSKLDINFYEFEKLYKI